MKQAESTASLLSAVRAAAVVGSGPSRGRYPELTSTSKELS